MGTLLDTTVFVDLERAVRRQPAARAWADVTGRLAGQLDDGEEVGIAAITASELLHGVHRASEEHRGRREAFVEGVLAAFPALPFDLRVARIHARLWVSLISRGAEIGAHDRIVAATAISAGWLVATSNRRHFDQVTGLEVKTIQLV